MLSKTSGSALGGHACVAHVIVYTVTGSLENPVYVENGEAMGFYGDVWKNRLLALESLLETLQRELRPTHGMRSI